MRLNDFTKQDSDNIFDQILRKIENEQGRKIKRVPRTAQDENSFYLTIIFEDYKLLEVTLTKQPSFSSFDCIAFEIETEIY